MRRDRTRVKKASWKHKMKERRGTHGSICPVYPGMGVQLPVPTSPERGPQAEADRRGTSMIGGQPLREQVEASVYPGSVHMGEGAARRYSSQGPLSTLWLRMDDACPSEPFFFLWTPSAAALSEILCLQRIRGNGVKGHSIPRRELSPRRLGKMASPKGVSGGQTSRPVPIFSRAWRLPQQTLNEPNYIWHFSPTMSANSHPLLLAVSQPGPRPWP